MTDIEILEKIKEGDEDAKIMLWERNLPRIKSNYYKNRNFFNILRIPQEDYIQESFFYFLDCLNYVDISKMKEKNSSFGTAFHFFLLKLKWKYQAEVKSKGFPLFFDPSEQDEIEDDMSMIKSFFIPPKELSVEFDDILRREEVFNFVQGYVESSKGKDKRILEMHLSGEPLSKISKSLDQGYNTTRQMFKKIQKDIKKEYISKFGAWVYE